MGGWNPERIILIEFDAVEQIHIWFQAKEYVEIAPFRGQSTTSRSIIVEGYAPPGEDA
jgi:uncharacterized protein (DUF1330 family)